ncbi:MAG: DUF1286 domain-containing protein [Thermoproteus sp.]
MKLETHIIFSLGLVSFALHSLGAPPYKALTIAFIASLFGNYIIDKIGHRGHVRTPLTHTLPRSIAWSLLSVPLAVLPFGLASLPAALMAAALTGPSHMLLDALTEEGIYVKREGKWRRWAIAHFRYNNFVANGIAALAGIIMLVASLSV